MTLCIPKLLQENFYFFSLQYIRMSGKNINFNDKKIKKSIFYKNKAINNTEEIAVSNILVSKKELYESFKYFQKNFLKKFLEECKYIQEKIKIVTHIDEDLENS